MNQTEELPKPQKALSRGIRLLLVGLVAVVLAGGYGWFRQLQAAAEEAAKTQLRELKAIVQLDTRRQHVATVMIRENLESALPCVAHLRHLSHLDLADTDFGDEDMRHIRHLPRLYSLVLSNTKITDAGLDALSGVPIQSLFLAGTAITARAMDRLGRLSTLKVLDLSHTNVQDNLSGLASARKLEWLVLTGVDLSGVGEAAVDALARMPKLGRLTLIDTHIDEELVSRLRRARPTMNIEVSPGSSSLPTEG